MAFWSWKKSKEAQLKLWNLPGEVGTVSLPDSLSIEMEDEKTLLAYPASDVISLRFSSISFTTKGGDSGDLAKSHVRNKASEGQLPYYEVGDKGVLSYEQQSENDVGQKLLVTFWYVGTKCTMVVASATILTANLADPGVKVYWFSRNWKIAFSG
jgi:hypothetical protein